MVDLSADFRFKDAAVYEKWYQAHSAKDLLAEAVYGLPELHGYAVSRARLVGNPGCYPTCVILGLAPLVQNKLVRLDSLIADCKSGVSGAGRQAVAGHPVSARSTTASGPTRWRSTATTRRWSRS